MRYMLRTAIHPLTRGLSISLIIVTLGLLLTSIFVTQPVRATSQRSIVFNGSNQYGKVILPASAPYTSIGAFRLEFQLHDFLTNFTNIQQIFFSNNFAVRIDASSATVRFFDFASGGTDIGLNLSVLTNPKVRIQRDVANSRITLEAWNGDGSGYVSALPTAVTNISNLNFSGGDGFAIGSTSYAVNNLLHGSLAFSRWYSSVLPLNSAAPSSNAGGDLLDYEFDSDNGNDSSANAQNLTLFGNSAFVDTPGSTQVTSQRSIVFNGSSQYGKVILPASPPYTSVGAFRYEFQIHDFRVNYSGVQRISFSPHFTIRIDASSTSLRFFEPLGNNITLDLNGRTNVKIRVQRDTANSRLTAEMWNADGTNYISATPESITSIGNLNESADDGFAIGANNWQVGEFFQGKIAFFRWYSSVLPLNSAPPSTSAGGDLLDYEFNADNGNDSSPNAQHMTLTGSPTFIATPGIVASFKGLVLNGTDSYARVTLPNAAPFISMTSWTMEARIRNVRTNYPVHQALLSSDTFVIRINANSSTLIFFDLGVGDTCQLDISSLGPDFLLRIVRDPANSRIFMEASKSDGSIILPANIGPTSSTGARNLGGHVLSIGAVNYDPPSGFCQATVDFFRWKTGAATPGAAIQFSDTTANLLRYEFEDNLNDSSPNALHLTGAGTLTYSVSPSINPRAVAPTNQTLRTTDTMTLNGAGSIAGDVPIISYTWTFISGPNTPTITSPSSAVTTVTGFIAGEYRFGLTVADGNGNTGTVTIIYGVVAVNSNDVVQIDDPKIALLIGPQLMYGSGNVPWTFYDTNQVSEARKFAANFPNKPLRSTLSGTISVSGNVVTGTGTHFLTELATNITYYLQDSGGAWHGVTGFAINSDTQLTLSSSWAFGAVSGAHSVNINGEYDTQYIGYMNYYDVVLVLYQLYYRTGLTEFRDDARRIADVWWKSPFIAEGTVTDFDTNTLSPRSISLGGLMLRAQDGKIEYWDWIDKYTALKLNEWVTLRKSNGGLYYGTRDGGFMMLYGTWLSQVLPDSYPITGGGTETGGANKRAAYLAALIDDAVNYYARLQQPDGSWRWLDDWNFNNNGDGVPTDDGFGQTPFHVGLLLEGLSALHQVIKDNPSYAAQALTIRAAILASCKNMEESYINLPVSGYTPPTNWRGMHYNSYSIPYGNPPFDAPTYNGDPNSIRDLRQNNATIPHAYGYAFSISGDAGFKTFGDELMASVSGNGQGPNADTRYALIDYSNRFGTGPLARSAKDYDEFYRASGRYLAYRILPTNVPANLPPVVKAGPDRTLVNGTTSATLSGAAIDPEGGAVTYQWTQIIGSPLTITSPSSPTTTVTGTFANDSTYAFRLAATDAAANTIYDFVTINTASVASNQPPVPSIQGGNQSLPSGTTNTTLVGSATDPEGDPIVYRWIQTYGPTVTITSPMSATTTVTGLTNGNSYGFRLITRDTTLGVTATSTTDYVDVRVTVAGMP